MKRIIIVFLLIFPLGLFSQIDVGVLGGGSYYLGELNTNIPFKHTHIAGGVFLRYNYSKRYSFRGSLMAGGLSGNDLSSKYLYNIRRAHSFYTPFVELSGQLEFNFLPYLIGSDKDRYTTYIATGATFLIASYASRPYQVALPMALGFKISVSKSIGFGMEYSYRKTFTDYLDRLGGAEYHILNTSDYYPLKQNAYLHDKDWYSLAVIFISYKLPSNTIKCHVYDQ
ncbi:MAG: hypothetical protein Kow0068_00330 [Marinilabiliales bacterium]